MYPSNEKGIDEKMKGLTPKIVMSHSERNALVSFYNALEDLGRNEEIDYEGFLITLREGGTRSQGLGIIITDEEEEK